MNIKNDVEVPAKFSVALSSFRRVAPTYRLENHGSFKDSSRFDLLDSDHESNAASSQQHVPTSDGCECGVAKPRLPRPPPVPSPVSVDLSRPCDSTSFEHETAYFDEGAKT